MKNSLCKTAHDYTIPKTKIVGGLNTKLHTKAVSLAFENIHELSFFFDNDKVTIKKPDQLGRSSEEILCTENLSYYANEDEKIKKQSDFEKLYLILDLPEGKFSFLQANFHVTFIPDQKILNQIKFQELLKQDLFSKCYKKEDTPEIIRIKVDNEEITFNKSLLCLYYEVFQRMLTSSF